MATRSKRFVAGLLTGYGSIATNLVFTMTSIPLALHYLDKEQFGLWALALQINGYLALIDLGMSGAVARFIADYKDDVNAGPYGSHLLTGGLVFLVQGLIIAGVGFILSWFAPGLFAVPDHLATSFRHLLLILSATAGAAVFFRSLSSPLWAFQRNDVINACASIGLLVNLAVLWLGLRSGWGVMSFAYAQLPILFGTVAVHFFLCSRKRYYPSAGHWGKPSTAIFKRMFHYGKDVLLVSLGSQLLNATQIMIISRWVGLEAAAVFSVSTKFYTMAMLLVNNPISSSASGLTEIYVRGEKERFISRYWDLISITLAISTLVATCLAAGNRSLVGIWTHGSIQWTWIGDLLLALMIVLRNMNGCFIGLFGFTKNWKPVRHIYMIEGIVFVPIAILLANWFGLNGVLFASLAAHLGITTVMSSRAARPIIGSAGHLVRSVAACLLLIGITSTFGWFSYRISMNPFVALAATALITAPVMIAAWFWILPETIRSEAATRFAPASRKLKGILGM